MQPTQTTLAMPPSSDRHHRRRPIRARRGMTAVLAMLYLTLISSLAVGFYATVTTASRVSHNERYTAHAVATAESMMGFVRLYMAQLSIEKDDSELEAFTKVYDQLSASVGNTMNMPGYDANPSCDVANRMIYIPGRPGGEMRYMALAADPNNPSADTRHGYVEIKQDPSNVEVYVVRAVGIYNLNKPTEIRRAIRMKFARSMNASKIFNYGVASKSKVSMNSNAKIKGEFGKPQLGSLLVDAEVAVPLEVSGQAEISGSFSYTNQSATPQYDKVTIGSYKQGQGNWDEVVKYVEEAPEFPTIDTTVFKQYAVNHLYPNGTGKLELSNTTRQNLYIHANTNPIFKSNCTLQGVIYIEQPNKVQFSSNTVIEGYVIADHVEAGVPAGQGEVAIPGTANRNVIDFNSNIDIIPIQPTSSFQYADELRQLKGAAILAPNFYLHFDSNVGSVSGSIVGSRIRFDSNSGGTIKGSVLNLDENTGVSFASNAVVEIQSTGTTQYPPGVFFSSSYWPNADTYQEVLANAPLQ